MGLSPAPVHAGPTPKVTCEACLVLDDTGRVLFARHPRRLLPNASTTKMITALVTRRETAPDEVVTVSAEAAATGGGGLDLVAGESYSVGDLLEALLLTSSNDAAVALAEHVAGSEAAFVHEMNELALAVGARRTNFVTAHGLDQPGHHSTAVDLARIAEEVLSDPALAAIVAAPSTTIEGPKGAILLENRNLLLESYRGAIGVKTGYTAGAGNVLVAAAERHDRRLITVVLDSDDSFVDSTALLDLGFRKLRRGLLLEEGVPVGALVFDGAGSTGAVATDSVRGITDPSSVVITFAPEDVQPPFVEGERVGTIVIRDSSGRVVGEVDAATDASVPAPHSPWGQDFLADLLRLAAAAAP